MDVSEMIKKIRKVSDIKKRNELEILNSKKIEFEKKLQFIVSKQKQLSEISLVVLELFNNRLIKNEMFLTEGIHHHVGFSGKSFSLFGVCGGGYSGESVFFDIDNCNFRISEWYKETEEYNEYSVVEMVNQMENFSNSIISHIEEIYENLHDDIFVQSVEKFVHTLN